MKIILRSLFLLSLPIHFALSANSADKFDSIKSKIELSALVHVEVIIAIESEIFNAIDSTIGDIYIAGDGRYSARLGDDLYLNDGLYQWEYIAENNQVARQLIKDNDQSEGLLAFYKNLDNYYQTRTISSDYQYQLYRLNESDDALPDSMTVFLASEDSRISRIEYFDLNDDLNKIYFMAESFSDKIPDHLFDIDFPDSAEIINLP